MKNVTIFLKDKSRLYFNNVVRITHNKAVWKILPKYKAEKNNMITIPTNIIECCIIGIINNDTVEEPDHEQL